QFQPRDLAILVADQRRPVEGRLPHGPAIAGRILELVGKARRIDQELLGNTAADHAGSAHPVFLGDHHARAITGCDARRPNATGPCPDDEEIDLLIRHDPSLARPGSDLNSSYSAWPRFFISARICASTSSENLLAQFSAKATLWSRMAGSTRMVFCPTA